MASGEFIPGTTDPLVFVQGLMRAAMGHMLPAWLRWFDPDGDGMVSLTEFTEGMRKCGYDQDCKQLFDLIDEDESSFLTLYELDLGAADLWAAFRSWAALTFTGTEDMVLKLRGQVLQLGQKKWQSMKTMTNSRTSIIEPETHFIREQFAENAARLGWYGAHEDVLYDALDLYRQGYVTKKQLKWFEKSKNMLERRQAIRPGAKRPTPRRISASTQKPTDAKQNTMLRSLLSFISFLRARNKNRLMRAWRTLLDPEGRFYISKQDLIRTCIELTWKGDPNSLWHAVSDAPEGFANFEDLCVSEARELGEFKCYCEKHFGSLKSFWNKLLALEKSRQKKNNMPRFPNAERVQTVEKNTFIKFCRKLQGAFNPFTVWPLLDWQGQGNINYQDELKNLESWNPAIWLHVEPGIAEAAKFKADLLKEHLNHPVKAWRSGVDTNGSGMARWGEFHNACSRIGWRNESDMAKAWLALDTNGMGFLTLRQLDERMADALANFRRWCYAMYGSVLLAFKELDKDESGTLSYEEFTAALNESTFKGSVEETWHALNQDGDSKLSKYEVHFLDDMELDVLEAFSLGTAFLKEAENVSRPGSPDSCGGGEEQEDFNMMESSELTNTQQDGMLPNLHVRHHLLNIIGLAGKSLDLGDVLADDYPCPAPLTSTPLKTSKSQSRSKDRSPRQGDGPARSARQRQLPSLPSPRDTPRSARVLPWPSHLPPKGVYLGGRAYLPGPPQKHTFGLD
eukprot:TRINITY_DN57575_c0_g1_i1.p1 TRINITY_DN57575_c0_g1~~TRINITY_DN57575_c0_g1_i1.p1  ORF type:complete len:738 (-),score=139.22 TRINITY_DN57575_c0_g1_i1:158-2371(-)